MLIINATGRLGNDPEAFQSGTIPGANFNLAVNTGKDETTWLKCAVFGSSSGRVLDNLKKGMKVTVNGTGKQNFFQKKDGSEGSNMEVVVLRFDISFPPKDEASDVDPYPAKKSNVTPFPDKKSFNNNDIY
jgi:single-strand DNA-binding protein